MISINLLTPKEMQNLLAKKFRNLRLISNLTQLSLSEKSGVSYGSLKKFEHTGEISLESLLKLALALGRLDDFNQIFAEKTYERILSLDELIDDKKRKRGRK
jgi:transcriptional regulator with XRE-family HTH domain